jgi:hypothetical protein
VLVHGGDIRVPLGLTFEPEPALAAVALDFLTGPWPIGMVPLGRLRGISLRDNASSRVWRKGAEIRGPLGALMMAAVGRSSFLDQLDGPGLLKLRQRLTA